MSILHRYIFREIFKFLAIVLAAVVTVYLAVDFFEKIDNFMEAGLPIFRALSYFTLKIPLIVSQVLPVAILLSVLIAFGLMGRNNETTALRSCGVSTWYLGRPVLGIGLLLTLALFLISELVVPLTMSKANHIWLREVRKEKAVLSEGKNIWIKGERSIIHVRFYSPVEKAAFGVSVNRFDEGFRLVRRLDAKKGVYREGRWILSAVMEQTLDEKDGTYRVDWSDSLTEPLPFAPEDLNQVVKKSEEMNLAELLAYVRKVNEEGYDATAYRVDLHAKLSFPFVCLLMSIIGTGFSATGRIRGLAVGIASGLGIAFLYWVLHSLFVSFGYGEMLPPVIAAWAANAVFFCSGLLILMYGE